MDSIAAQLNGKSSAAPAEIPAHNILEFNQLKDFLTSSFLAMQQKAAAERELFTLATQVAHDIRSPLAALQIVVQMSANIIPKEQCVILHDAAERINDIANNLLHDYKLSRKDKLSAELITNVIDKIITEKRTQYFNKNITFAFLADDDTRGLSASVNLAQFNRVLSNLLNNAIEAIKHEDGKITIKIKKDNNLVTLGITDNGCGMPKEMISQIGNASFTSGKKDGSGIGLFTAVEKIKQWQGTLSVESEVNQGTTITISLPVVNLN
jgi:signal transduction histidine kinase